VLSQQCCFDYRLISAGTWGGYTNVNKLLSNYNVPRSNISYTSNSGLQWTPGDDIAALSQFVNHDTGTIVPVTALPLNRTAIMAAAEKYIVLYAQVRGAAVTAAAAAAAAVSHASAASAASDVSR
jgi:hypothetical protein